LGASLVFCSLLLPAGTTSQEFSTGGDFDQESQAVSLYAAFHFPFHFSKMRSLSLLPPLHAPSRFILIARQTGQTEQTLFAGRRFFRYNMNIVPPFSLFDH
jgi:hypothetical protein